MGMLGEWAKEWSKTKKAFEAKTGKKKPSKTILGKFRMSTGFEGSCKKLDKAFPIMQKSILDATANPIKKLKPCLKIISSFENETKKLEKLAKDYIKVLEKAIKGDKDAESTYVKQLAILKADIKAIVASCKGQINMNRDIAKKVNMVQVILNNVHISINSGVKSAKLFVAKVKADPTAKNFNDGISKAARDISQSLTNVVKYKSSGKITVKKDPSNMSKVLVAWADKGRKVPTDADKKGVLRELGAFLQIVVAISKWSKNETS